VPIGISRVSAMSEYGQALDVAEDHDRPELVRELPEKLLERGEGGASSSTAPGRRFDLREGVGVGERRRLRARRASFTAIRYSQVKNPDSPRNFARLAYALRKTS
jgi:hypothetical protein